MATPRNELLNCVVSAEVVEAFVTAMAVLRDEAAAEVIALASAISAVNVEMELIACNVLFTMAKLLL